MKKKSAKKEPLEKAARRLARAQLDFHLAQAKRSDEVMRGELEAERVRERTERRVMKATMRLERTAGQVARAQAIMSSLTAAQAAARAKRAERGGLVDSGAAPADGTTVALTEVGPLDGASPVDGDIPTSTRRARSKKLPMSQNGPPENA